MPLTILGDIVNYIPTQAANSAPRAAIIIDLNADGTANLRVYNGFVQGTTDVENVAQTATGDPGTFYYPRGAKGAGRLNMPLNDSTDDIVALENGSAVAADGDDILIDQEYMTITDATDPNNLKVTRAQGGSTAAAHAVGALVKIGVPLPKVAEAAPESASPKRAPHVAHHKHES